ncbi:hypothetical protein XF_1853 [Xylella fastidiosa 9a5c]|uniref:Uncharacterized protein n=1 Tax=Xylella fastidiosa (strain 9a5c) TaxID=160492 RepID=Q9PCC8_XYLFA|nr:hypothetical protein XF_1853 [Xylella fastidiosa 9a5c]
MHNAAAAPLRAQGNVSFVFDLSGKPLRSFQMGILRQIKLRWLSGHRYLCFEISFLKIVVIHG